MSLFETTYDSVQDRRHFFLRGVRDVSGSIDIRGEIDVFAT